MRDLICLPPGIGGRSRAALGLSTLALMLALSLPGVRVVRADAETASGDAATQAGAFCPASPVAQSSAPIDEFIQQEAVLAAAGPLRTAQAGDQTGTVSLNNRGYNYGPPVTGADPAVLHFELQGRR